MPIGLREADGAEERGHVHAELLKSPHVKMTARDKEKVVAMVETVQDDAEPAQKDLDDLDELVRTPTHAPPYMYK
eukprot:1194464-Prorocentrum_minimum.AAC.4